MATFYLLPPRPLMAQHFVTFLQSVFPGLQWDTPTRQNLTEALEAAATCRPDVFVIFREDLPEEEPALVTLMEAYGAEEGDEVIDIQASEGSGRLVPRQWEVRPAA